jgi:hypothetical protein
MASIFIADQKTFPDTQVVEVPIRKKNRTFGRFSHENIKLRASTKTGLKSAAAED